jgi:hypothetical protein
MRQPTPARATWRIASRTLPARVHLRLATALGRLAATPRRSGRSGSRDAAQSAPSVHAAAWSTSRPCDREPTTNRARTAFSNGHSGRDAPVAASAAPPSPGSTGRSGSRLGPAGGSWRAAGSPRAAERAGSRTQARRRRGDRHAAGPNPPRARGRPPARRAGRRPGRDRDREARVRGTLAIRGHAGGLGASLPQPSTPGPGPGPRAVPLGTEEHALLRLLQDRSRLGVRPGDRRPRTGHGRPGSRRRRAPARLGWSGGPAAPAAPGATPAGTVQRANGSADGPAPAGARAPGGRPGPDPSEPHGHLGPSAAAPSTDAHPSPPPSRTPAAGLPVGTLGPPARLGRPAGARPDGARGHAAVTGATAGAPARPA